MNDYEIARVAKLIGLLGLCLSVIVWAWAERSERRKTLVSVSAGAALISALIYLLGIMAGGDSGARRLLPRFL